MIDNWLLFSAIGTLTLAAAAFATIYQNYRNRRDDRALVHKLQSLDEIRNWAHETLLLMFSAYTPNEDEKRRVKALFSIQSLAGASILVAAGIFGKEMVEKVNAIQEPIHKFELALWDEDALKDETIRLELQRSLCELLKVVYSRKIELLPPTEILQQWRSESKS